MSQVRAGRIEFHDQSLVKGWAYEPASPSWQTTIDVVDGDAVIARFTPSVFRWDLRQAGYGDGKCGFAFPLDARLLDGRPHDLHFRFASDGEPLAGSPVHVEAPSEARLVPLEATELRAERVLVLAPHPDDEALSCGGSILLHRRRGEHVKVVILTDGSRADSPGRSAEATAELRESEARAAAEVLGVSDLEFWRLPDRGLEADSTAAARLRSLLVDYRPELVYAPSPLEFHPDHRAAAELLWRAVSDVRLETRVAFYDLNRPILVNTLVDVTAVVEAKEEACNRYASQQGDRPYTEAALAYNRWRALTVAPRSRYAEAFHVLGSEAIHGAPVEAFVRHQYLPFGDGAGEPPLVSIVVRTKNRPGLLRDALSSLAAQTHPRLDVVVVNDGEERPAAAVVEEFRGVLPLRFRHVTEPIGRGAAANVGVQMAAGKYVNLLDDDDVLYARHVERLAGYLEATGEEFAYSDCELATYGWDGSRAVPTSPRALYMGLDFDLHRLHLGNFIPTMTAMFTRALWERAGGFDETLDVYEDWDLWLRMCRTATPQHLPGVTAEYRVFATHAFDEREWTLRIYEKHRDYWTLERMADALKHLDRLEAENRELRRALTAAEARLGDGARPR